MFFYGFDDLTPVELDAIETLSGRANAVITVSLTYEPGRPALGGACDRGRGAARACAVGETRCRHSRTTMRPDSRAALHHLERHLFEPDPPSLEPDPGGCPDGGRR